MALTKEEIIEGNRLIKAFMNPEKAKDIMEMKDLLVEYACHYESQWSALMPVVEKIESIYDSHHGYFGVHISSNSCSIQGTNLWKAIQNLDEYGDVYCSDPNAILSTKIESTWYACASFIKWWNEYSKSNQ